MEGFASQKIIAKAARLKDEGFEPDRWKSNGIPYDSFYNTNGKTKSDIETDILIDDYPDNIIKFYPSNRTGILFLQPWNKGHECLTEDQIFSADGWAVVVRIIENTA